MEKKYFSPDKENKAALPFELAALIVISCATKEETLAIKKQIITMRFIINYF